MPNRHEPVTVLMVLHTQEKCAHLHPDCLDPALHDCNTLGLYYGRRLSEWAKNDADKITLINIDGLSTAFVYKDMIFFGANNHTLPQSWSSELDISEIAFVQLQWRTKKNMNNGETITQLRHAGPGIFSVLVALRIRHRYRRFNDHEHCPLAMYGTSKKLLHSSPTYSLLPT